MKCCFCICQNSDFDFDWAYSQERLPTASIPLCLLCRTCWCHDVPTCHSVAAVRIMSQDMCCSALLSIYFVLRTVSVSLLFSSPLFSLLFYPLRYSLLCYFVLLCPNSLFASVWFGSVLCAVVCL